MTYYICVGGCRNFYRYDVLEAYLDKVLQNLKNQGDICIISGAAPGVDSLAIRYASERGFRCLQYPAAWDKYGKAAGPRRNAEMVAKSSHIVAFWDGSSRGTYNLIQNAKRAKKPLKVKIISID